MVIGQEMIEETIKIVNMIRKRIEGAQEPQKSYADSYRRNLELDIGDHIFLKISLINICGTI